MLFRQHYFRDIRGPCLELQRAVFHHVAIDHREKMVDQITHANDLAGHPISAAIPAALRSAPTEGRRPWTKRAGGC